MERKPYPTDVTDGQWRLVKPSIPPPQPGGRPRETNMREVVNGILYVVRTGCSWRQLPHDFPPWITVHYYFRRFQGDGGVDLSDFATFALCYAGAVVTVPPPGCTEDDFSSSDIDGDNDVDLSDFATIALNYTGAQP